MFNSSYDTLVYTNGDTIFMQDLVSKKVASFRWAGQDLRSALIAAGDFRGDGFNEVVIATNGGSMIVAVAVEFDSRGRCLRGVCSAFGVGRYCLQL